MPDYINRGDSSDAGLAILIGLVVGIIMISLFANHDASKSTEVKKQPEQSQVQAKPKEEPKPAEAAQPTEQKEDCTFWRTMYFANIGKSMGNYYFIMWQNCENQQ